MGADASKTRNLQEVTRFALDGKPKGPVHGHLERSATAHDAKPLALATHCARNYIPAHKHVPGRTNTLFCEGLDKACNFVLFKVREIPVGHGVSFGLVSACDL